MNAAQTKQNNRASGQAAARGHRQPLLSPTAFEEWKINAPLKCIPIVYRGDINCNVNLQEDTLARTRQSRDFADTFILSQKRRKRHIAAKSCFALSQSHLSAARRAVTMMMGLPFESLMFCRVGFGAGGFVEAASE